MSGSMGPGRRGGVEKEPAQYAKVWLNTTKPSLNTALRVLPFLDHTITPAAHQNSRETPQGGTAHYRSTQSRLES